MHESSHKRTRLRATLPKRSFERQVIMHVNEARDDVVGVLRLAVPVCGQHLSYDPVAASHSRVKRRYARLNDPPDEFDVVVIGYLVRHVRSTSVDVPRL